MKKRDFKFVKNTPHEYKDLQLIGGISRIQESDVIAAMPDKFFGVDTDGNIVPVDGSWWGKRAVLHHLENKKPLTGEQVLEFLGHDPPQKKETIEVELNKKFKKDFREFRAAFMKRHESEIKKLRNLLQYSDDHYIYLSQYDAEDNNIKWFLDVFTDNSQQ